MQCGRETSDLDAHAARILPLHAGGAHLVRYAASTWALLGCGLRGAAEPQLRATFTLREGGRVGHVLLLAGAATTRPGPGFSRRLLLETYWRDATNDLFQLRE